MVEIFRRYDPPQTTAEKLVSAINDIEGIYSANISEKQPEIIIEFHMPDQDVLYPSALTISSDEGELVEAVIRLGPLGNRGEMSRMEIDDVEGMWTDVALDALSEAGVLTNISDRELAIDLGDRWVDERARPHIRIHRNEDGHDVKPGDIVNVIDETAQRFESRFGTLEDRMMDRKFADYYDRG